MAKLYENYSNNAQMCWYDSSNVLFSKCYDNPGNSKVLKIIFKNGRTYLYRDVDAMDYILFRDAESNGTAFVQYIKKYPATRIQDTDLGKLEEMKNKMINEATEFNEQKVSSLSYTIEYCDSTGEFALKLGDRTLHRGIEGQVSIINLFKSIGLQYGLTPVSSIESDSDENDDRINVD